MAYIDNSETSKELNDAIRGNAVSNIAPTQVNNSIQPVINVNPKDYRRIHIIRRATTSGTVYTTPTDKDFFLCGCEMVATNNVASQASNTTLTVQPKGEAAVVISSLQFHTTALIDTNSQNSYKLFDKPILLERGTNVTFGTTNAVVRSCIIFGYMVEP